MILRPLSFRLVLSLTVALAALSSFSACHRSTPSARTAKTTPAPDSKDTGDEKGADLDEPGVHLKPEEVQKLGVITEALPASTHAPEASGFGTVVSHESIALSLADLRTAAAVARQSRAALERVRLLAGTAGAMPIDTLETAERQSTVDDATLELARQRLSSAYGQRSPWRGNDDSPLLKALAMGDLKLVRVTFPMSALTETARTTIRLGRIGVGRTAKTWDSSNVWSAPADNSMPGRSFFAVFKGNYFGEGERLLAWTPVGDAQDGVLIPASAAIITGGKYWCYVEEAGSRFVRTEFDPGVPVSGGYFVTGGVQGGDKVVVNAAGQLLARELNPASEAE